MEYQDSIEFDAIANIHVLDWIATEASKRDRASKRSQKIELGRARRARRAMRRRGE